MGQEFSVYMSCIGNLSKVSNAGRNNRISFKSLEKYDSFQAASVEKFYDRNFILNEIKKNPEIKKILVQNNIPLQFNFENLQDLKDYHCRNTAEIAGNIAKKLPPALKDKVNLKHLKDGAILHDIGKIFIPDEILNKQSKLTSKEREIIDLHSLLGYELLKNSKVNNEVLKLVKYHHLNKTDIKNFIPDINLQILNIADKYSALTEKRAYKPALEPKQALTVLHSEVVNGDIHPFVFKALVDYINPNNSKLNISSQKI